MKMAVYCHEVFFVSGFFDEGDPSSETTGQPAYDQGLNFPANLRPPDPPALKFSLKNGVYECEHCGATCLSKDLYRRHVMEAHSQQAPFVCEVCCKGYFTRSGLRAHQLRYGHQKDLPVYVCQICDLPFNKKKALQAHLKFKHMLDALPPIDTWKKYTA